MQDFSPLLTLPPHFIFIHKRTDPPLSHFVFDYKRGIEPSQSQRFFFSLFSSINHKVKDRLRNKADIYFLFVTYVKLKYFTLFLASVYVCFFFFLRIERCQDAT